MCDSSRLCLLVFTHESEREQDSVLPDPIQGTQWKIRACVWIHFQRDTEDDNLIIQEAYIITKRESFSMG